ncbi:MAG: vanadium-dependent haloperoxidase [Myxococcota bacterium]
MTKPHDDPESPTTSEDGLGLSRRAFLGAASTPALLAVAGTAGGAAFAAPSLAHARVLTPEEDKERYRDTAVMRRDAAKANYDLAAALAEQKTNDDERRYEDLRGSFHKCLPQNKFGEVKRAAYRRLRRALRTGDPYDFDAIPLSSRSDRRLANPQGALARNLTGIDSHGTRMRPAPAFASAETAAEVGEVYWHALLRDVPFNHYTNHPLAEAALDDLNGFSETVGPKVRGQVTSATLFRGPTPGDLAGPYVSQFLWKTVPFGLAQIEQVYPSPAAGDDFMIDAAEWLAIQRGQAPSRIPELVRPRYINDARALGEYVHVDVLSQAYLFAGLIALGMGAFGVETYADNPSQGGFTSLGGPDFLDSLWHVGNLSLRAAWFQKWAAHRRLRPETYAGRVHFTSTGDRRYDVHDDILHSDAVRLLVSKNGTAFLPMQFPEGSPTHPAYPAGHATVAGSCCTVLKAFLNEDMVFSDPVVSNDDGSKLEAWVGEDLTVGGEINKLASNIALGRDLAGVHYRSDGIDGILVGEQVALTYLADKSRTYNEDFEGFTLTKFDGNQVLIAGGSVYEI